MNITDLKDTGHSYSLDKDGLLFWTIESGISRPICITDQRSAFIIHILVVRGEISIKSNQNEYKLSGSDYAHIIDCSSLTVLSSSETALAYVVICTDLYITMLLKNAGPIPFSLIVKQKKQPIERLDAKTKEALLHRMLCLNRSCSDEGHLFRSDMIKCDLKMLLMDLVNLHLKSWHDTEKLKSERKKELFVRFIGMLSKSAKRRLTVKDYASALCITPQYLNRIVREYNNKSVSEMIDIALTGEIAGRLEDSTATMQEIANEFNFPDQSSMAKFFKRNTGYTLTEYRHNHCRHYK